MVPLYTDLALNEHCYRELQVLFQNPVLSVMFFAHGRFEVWMGFQRVCIGSEPWLGAFQRPSLKGDVGLGYAFDRV